MDNISFKDYEFKFENNHNFIEILYKSFHGDALHATMTGNLK